MPPGESSKSFPVLEKVCEALIAARIERGDLVVALGGGVIGDLAGFAAAVVRRGLDYVQVPTTLLAQVDSSVGGKTAINSSHGKNLVGAFHQPILVVADTALLDTLSAREFRAGYAEVAKYGLIGDAGLLRLARGQLAGDVRRRAGARARHRGELPDEGRDRGARRARDRRARAAQSRPHLRPRASKPRPASPTGCCTARRSRSAWCWPSSSRRAAGCCRRPTPSASGAISRRSACRRSLADVAGGAPGADRLMELIAQDKKVKRGALTFILVRGIGGAFIAPDVDAAEVRAFLVEKLAER